MIYYKFFLITDLIYFTSTLLKTYKIFISNIPEIADKIDTGILTLKLKCSEK